ncbi:PREDICTED: probable signal peptidase complex subunit 2-like [Fragaria vesca subsp. vesca]
MQETKDASSKPKKVNLSDHSSIKHLLDESVSEIVKSCGYVEDTKLSNLNLLIGTIVITIALFAQFYKKKFPENYNFLIGCILISYVKEKNAILFTHPPVGSFSTTGLVVSSKLPRFSDLYTLTIASADAKSVSANKPVELTRSVTKWFTKDGELVEGLLWKEVDGLINKYAREPKKSK